MSYETTETNIINKNLYDLTNFDNLPSLDDASAVACSFTRYYLLNIQQYISFFIIIED